MSAEYAFLHHFDSFERAAEFARKAADTADQWAPVGAYDVHVSEPIRDRNRGAA